MEQKWCSHIRTQLHALETLPTGGESRYKLPEPGLRPDSVAYVFVFLGSIIICPLYKFTLSDQAQVTL
jgi:hypothetical protein